MAWYKNTACIASRTLSLPLNENETFERPPLTFTCGRVSFIRFVASIKSSPYLLCSSMPVATAKILGSKIISSGGKPIFSVSSLYARVQI